MMQRVVGNKTIVFCAFLGFFLLLFLQLPLNNAMPGSTDSWYNLALFNYYGNHIAAFFTGEPAGMINYPEGNIVYYGESSFLSAGLYLPFKWMQIPDLWSFYLFYSLVFALNGFSLYLLLDEITNDRLSSLAGGLIFPCLNFTIAHLDHQNALVFFPMFLALQNLLKGISWNSRKYVVLAGVIAGLQVYFASYIFFMCVISIVLIVTLYSGPMSIMQKGRFLLFTFIPIMLLILPYAKIYILDSGFIQLDVDSKSLALLDKFGLYFKDLFRVLPGNILYEGCCSYSSELLFQKLLYHWHAVFIGLLLPLFGLVGICYCPKKWRIALLAILITGILFALGPFVGENNWIMSPMFYIYKLLPVLTGFSHLSRFYFIVVIVLVILATLTLSYFLKAIRLRALKLIVLIGFVGSVLIENIPIPLVNYQKNQFISVPSEIHDKANKMDTDSSLLILPAYGPKSTLNQTIKEQNRFINGKRNAYRYMYWQTEIQRNVINANSSETPPNRVGLYKLIYPPHSLTSHFNQLKSKYQLQYIAFIKSQEFNLNMNYSDQLFHTKKLRKVAEDSQVAIFKVL